MIAVIETGVSQQKAAKTDFADPATATYEYVHPDGTITNADAPTTPKQLNLPLEKKSALSQKPGREELSINYKTLGNKHQGHFGGFDDVILEKNYSKLPPEQYQKLERTIHSLERMNTPTNDPATGKMFLRIEDKNTGTVVDIDGQGNVLKINDPTQVPHSQSPPLNKSNPNRAGPEASLFKGLGDAKTSPWLADGRIGVRAHLEEFRNGGSALLPKKSFEKYFTQGGTVGRRDGLFLTTRQAMDKLLMETKGDSAAIKQRLGIEPGNLAWDADLVRVDVYNPLLHNARFPHGMELGANPKFRWGGFTSGGMPEISIDPVKSGDFKISPVERQ